MNDPRPVPTAAECKAKAIILIRNAAEAGIELDHQVAMLRAAQVWATLATVPEPLEEVHGQLIEAEPFSRGRLIEEAFRHLPAVLCPHGYIARASLIREPGKEPRIYFTWRNSVSGSCTQGCP